MLCWAPAAPVLESALIHCAPPKPLAQALQRCSTSQATAASHASATSAPPRPASACCAARVSARLVGKEANWLPAESVADWPTLALLPDRVVSTPGNCAAVTL